MKTVTARSWDGKRKMRVPIVAQAGAWCVAKGVDMRGGKRKVMGYWAVYHAKSGSVLPYGHPRKKDALTVLRHMAEVPGNWNRDFKEVVKDERLMKRAKEAWFVAQVEIGTYIKL